MYEAAVVSFICREAGGQAVDEKGQLILTIQPEHPHQRTALYLGSNELVAEISEVLNNLSS
jgi:Fructose-1,6-bisphosphatase